MTILSKLNLSDKTKATMLTSPAAKLREVDDVVVKQRCRMDKLDNCGGFDMPIPGVAAGACRKQDQHRPEAFAATVYYVS